ncbi:MAG: MATE family efflux transporter [Aquificae bacterium]|nr:MATE family efflux transporter [Aquificota bacterium]
MSDLKRKILSLAIPAALNNFLDTIQLLIDMLMVGKISPEAIAAVGLSGQLIILIYAFLSTFYVGTNALVSRFYGAKEYKKADKTVFNTVILSLFFSIPFFIFSYFYNHIFFSFMGVNKEVLSLGNEYISILSFSIPFLFIGSVLYSALNASGDTKTPLFIGIFTNILNTALNYCLIFGNCGFPKLGVSGAALATAISYILEVIIYIFIFFFKLKKISFYPEFSLDLIKRVLKVGIPAGLEKVISFSSFLIFVKIIASFGTYTLAGYQIGLRIEGLAFMPGFGFAVAAMVLVGQYLGAKDPKKAEESAIETTKIASIFMGFIGIILILFPEPLVNIFTNDKKTIEEASLYLKIVGITQVPLAVEFVINGALRGAGATKITLIINNFSFWVFRIIPSFLAFWFLKGIIFVYLIMALETYLKAIMLWIIFKKGNWKNLEV